MTEQHSSTAPSVAAFGPPSFTLSLDCEGKWGVADSTAPWMNWITRQALDEAYDFIFSTLARHEVRATFAFTSLFAAPEDLARDKLRQIESSELMAHGWYRDVVTRSQADKQDGWRGHHYLVRAQQDGHEIGWHGFTHHLLAPHVGEAIANFEFDQAAQLSALQGIRYASAVYPRNAVGHVDKLDRLGIRYYRRSAMAPGSGSVLGSLRRIASECDVTGSMGLDTRTEVSEGRVGLPPGNFLYWPLGLRGMIPSFVTSRRWQSMLERSSRNGSDVHMWFHPHNLITAPAMRRTFDNVICAVGQLQRHGRLQSRTMLDIGKRYDRE